jgi:transcriptional regulator with XRE-family HTH domain
MIQQPELGKKVLDLRKAKGITQEELVEKCNLSVRTLQRIESGEVTPRPITVKLIFEALGESFDKAMENKGLTLKWLEQFYIVFIDLFNLKTNTMRKIMILSTPLLIAFITFCFIGSNVQAQNPKDIENKLTKFNSDFTKWFMAGQIDSLGTLYYKDASLILDNIFPITNNYLPAVTSREGILSYYKLYYSQNMFFTDRISKKIIFGDSIIIDIGILKMRNDSITKSGTYFSQWKYYKNNWCIENEMFNFD